MRFMVIVKATKDSEAGVMPGPKLLEDMGKYNQELVKAGVMLAGEGLHPSSKGSRVKFSGRTRSVTDGPFAETKELIAGFWLIQVRSRAEAIEWVKRAPNPHPEETELEIRQVFEAEDFAPAASPEQIKAEERMRAQAAARDIKSSPYLTFNGNCREAFRFYEQVLGGRIEIMMTHGESPIASSVPESWHDSILHARLVFGNQVLMGSDAAADRYQPPQGFSVAVSLGTVPDAERVFNALAEDGKVIMPFAPAFWAERFGMAVDRFGIPWIVNGVQIL
jgi:uncharacterized glyoxalase superfamily protein PhnB